MKRLIRWVPGIGCRVSSEALDHLSWGLIRALGKETLNPKP